MSNQAKTKAQLLKEISILNRKIKKLEKTETAYKQLEEALRYRESYLSTIIENQPGLVWLKDTESRFLAVNQAFAMSCGRQREEELVGKTDLDIWPRELAEKYRRDDFMIMDTGKPIMLEEPIFDKGETRWFETFKAPVLGEQGMIIGTTGYARDITERKRAETALYESEKRNRLLLENAEFPIVVTSIADGRGLFLNDRAMDFFNVSAEDRSSLRAHDFWVRPDDRVHFIDELTRHKMVTGYECELQSRKGSKCWVQVAAKVIEYEGVPAAFIVYNDITTRRQTEMALLRSKEQYQFVVENLKEVIFRTDAEGHWTFLNSAWAEVTGFSVEESLGRIFLEYVYPEDRQLNLEFFQPLIERKKNYCRHEIRYINKDGGFRWIEVWARLTLDEKGNATGTAGTLTDITDRKQAEDALRQSEEKYRTILESIDDGYFEQDLAGNFIFLNDSMCRIYGYPKEELMGMNYKQYTDKESGEKCLQVYRNIYKTGEPDKVVDFEIIRKDGTRRHIESSVSLQKDSAGKSIAFKGIIRDVTEHKQAEDALRQSEERYRNILESIQEGYFELDLAGNYTFVNEANCRFLRYTKEELVGMNYRRHTDEENAQKLYQPYHELYQTGKSIESLEVESIRKDGTKATYDTSVSLIRDNKGKPIGFRAISRDITERKQAEEEKRDLEERLQRAEKMEALGTLAGGVAHDLNNVLGVIVGYAELLLSEVDKLSPIRPRLMNIMKGSERAAAIVQDLLTMARRGVPGRKVLNLNKIILDYQNSPELEKLSSYHCAVRIKLDLESNLLNISGSSVHLGKVISNLVSNAAEAMPKGGDLTIKTANQHLDKPIHGYDHVRGGDYVVLSITDTGEGIPSADLQRIFEPFYTKKVMGKSGTGLGLAVVWGTVKDHQGYINVQSEEGKGSTFTIYFPVTREEISAESASVSVSEYMGKGETILVVDDVREQRDLAAEMLRKLNYKVSGVSGGEEAVAYIKEHKVALLVLDMIMDPGMDGLDTYKGVLEIRPKQKAIIVSGFSETERVNEARALGAGEYVKKPYIIERLGLAVRRELDRK